MKKVVVFLILVLFFFNGITINGATSITHEKLNTQLEHSFEININLPNTNDLKLNNYNNWNKIEHEDFVYLTNPGKPMIPVKKLLIALPPNAIFENIKITEFKFLNLSGVYNIMPYPSIYLLNYKDDSPEHIYEKSNEKYLCEHSQSDFYPQKIVNLNNIGKMRKYSYISFTVCPFRYFPESGKLQYFDSCKIIINYSYPSNNDFYMDSKYSNNNDLFDYKASILFNNFKQVKDLYNSNSNLVSNTDRFNYVIITSDEFVSLLSNSDFITWKTNLGHSVKIISISDQIIINQQGVDLAEQIRNFLRQYYELWGIKYVLIVGDYQTIPMRYCSPNPHWLEGTVPTDSYYSDLSFSDAESWDSNGDGYYGVYGQDNPDFMPEVYVGRIPTSDTLKISYTLNKIVRFEQDTSDWKKNALHGGAMLFYANEDHDTDIDHNIDGASCLDAIEKDFMINWMISHYSEHEGLSPSTYEWNPLNEEAFTNDWRNGQYAVVNWAAHGAPTSIGRVIWDWDDGDGIPEHDNGELIWGQFLDTYSNLEDDYPSIIFAVSCNVGYPEPTGNGNLGIDMLTKESFGSAVSVCSATRGAAASANWAESHSGAEALCYEFNRFMTNGPFGSEPIGEALYDSKFYVHDNFGWNHHYEYQNMYVYNLYGDPSMIRRGITSDAPSKPIINGPHNCRIDIEYEYTIKSVDPNGNDLYYYLDWGDGNIEEWIGPYISDEEIIISHKWSQQGTNIIRIKVKNINDKESYWNEYQVAITKNKPINILHKNLDKYSFLSPELRQIIKI